MTELDKKNLTMLLEEKNSKKPEFCREILLIKSFTCISKLRMHVNFLGIDYDFFSSKIKKEVNGFSLVGDEKEYFFTLASDENIKRRDKKMLKSFDKRQSTEALLRMLNLAGSKEFADSKVIIASSKEHGLTSFIEFIRNNRQMVLDYTNNVVMKKDEYYELFDVKVINKVAKDDLYIIWKLWKEHSIPLYYLLFFTKEIFRDLEKKVPWLLEKYSEEGSHLSYMYGDNSDFMFLDEKSNISKIVNKIKKQIL